MPERRHCVVAGSLNGRDVSHFDSGDGLRGLHVYESFLAVIRGLADAELLQIRDDRVHLERLIR